MKISGKLILGSFNGFAQESQSVSPSSHKKILIVVTSHDQLGNTGKKTGIWIEEFAAPYYYLTSHGADITIASPKGGRHQSIQKAMKLLFKPKPQRNSSLMQQRSKSLLIQ